MALSRPQMPAALMAQLPDDWAIQAPPEIPLGWEWAWRGWNRLDSGRPWYGGGFGPAVPGRIAWRDQAEYCDRYGHDHNDFEVICRALDDVFIEWHRDRNSPQAQR